MLTGVIDIGKTHSRLVLVDPAGAVVEQRSRGSASLETGGGWRALDTAGTWDWLVEQLASLGSDRSRLTRLTIATHGAAVAAVSGDSLVCPVPDYEFIGFDERPASVLDELPEFSETLCPVLPRGLNMGLQLDWLERHESAAFGRAEQLMPYAQYWAWKLSGVASSEVSSLGCHTLLWNPRARTWSGWAERRGWARRFAPMRAAWDTLGLVLEDLSRQTGIRRDLAIHAGVHDSNACLARWLRFWPRMTLVSTGTWVLVMAPGSSSQGLHAGADELGIVSVRNETVPTGRFMGGRELLAICAGADPKLASLDVLDRLLARGLLVLPGFESQGGPFREMSGSLVDDAGPVRLLDLSEVERATAAALYVAQMIVFIVDNLGGAQPVVLEGPFADNPIIVAVMAALLPARALHTVDDELEGTVRGAAMLTIWTLTLNQAPSATKQQDPPANLELRLKQHYRRWLRGATAL